MTNGSIGAIIKTEKRKGEPKMKKLNITINFDMDGTIADLYGVDNWLEYLINENPYPYEYAEPLLRLSALARKLNALQRNGYDLAIISWLSKSGQTTDRANMSCRRGFKNNFSNVTQTVNDGS